ncbi:MAG TPA: Gfo/Idh/MocA family oxidoreductase [Pseudomonadales bacterium]
MIVFGTLGTANITPKALVYPCADEPRAVIRCIAARDRERAEGFARWHHIHHVYDTYDQVIDDAGISALYNPLPISLHREWSIRALRAGRHVLCEKSFASNAQEAEEMAAVASQQGLVIMDAFHYRYHPVFLRAKEIYDSGVLGTVRRIDAEFRIPVTDTGGIRHIYALGGGVTMDIGCYPISWARHITGEEPEEVTAQAEVGPPYVDTCLEAQLRFPSGVGARVCGDMRPDARFTARLVVTGDRGTLTVNNPLVPQLGHSIVVDVGGEQTVETRDRRATYGYQLDAFIAAVEEGAPLLTGADDAVAQMRVVDRCYEAAGLPVRGLAL